MSNLAVISRDSVLVVDYRLVAQELGIKPKNVLANIDDHLTTSESIAAFGRVAFETEALETNGGVQSTRVAYLSKQQAEFLMTLSRNTPKVIAAKRNLVSAFDKALQAIKELTHLAQAQAQETERMKLELELIRAKQHYQDTGYAISVSTSAAMLQWLRGEAPPPARVEYRERYIDALTHQEIGSSTGRSLTQLITDAGLNPKSTRDRNRVKKILKCHRLDHDQMQGWSTASYLREYPVLEDGAYEQALKVVLAEVVEGESQPNLFVHSLSQPILSPGATTGKLKGEDS
jgi:phage regulator Rha-like protein